MRVKFRKCSRQIPVSPDTSSSVKIFWLDRIVRLLIIDSTPACSQYGDGISELCFLAIVLPFHYVDFFDAEPSQWGLRKRLRRGVLNAVVFRRGKNQN